MQADTESAQARDLFERMTRDANVESEWIEIDGQASANLVAQARTHDLIVREGKRCASATNEASIAERIGLSCGGPVLVLPDNGYAATFGRKILLAWKDCREAARALRDAWPFLERAEEIHVLTAARNGRRDDDKRLPYLFERHGCGPVRLILDRDTDRQTS